jgi:hypothetical protein
MLLAVAGLSEADVKKQTKKLADGDWSDFPPAEGLAFKFAHKIAGRPWAVNNADVQQLVKTFGEHRAIDVIWYCSWCNYMTRVADAFQLQLESKNVFAGRKRGAKKKERPATRKQP